MPHQNVFKFLLIGFPRLLVSPGELLAIEIELRYQTVVWLPAAAAIDPIEQLAFNSHTYLN